MTKSLAGDSTSMIQAKGGDGSEGGGGGGSGGRLLVSYLKGYSAASQPSQSHFWEGSYSLAGGLNGIIEKDGHFNFIEGNVGAKGEIRSDKCFGGYSGPFCSACAEGTFKYDYSYGVCKPCQNKPKNAFYSGKGASS